MIAVIHTLLAKSGNNKCDNNGFNNGNNKESVL